MTTPTPVLFQVTTAPPIPVELIQALNQTYFLHLLATDPGKVVPPGKTILSMMTRTQIGNHDDPANHLDPTAELQESVTRVVHRAFWNEALESLSSSLPSVQISRLKRLYADLLEAVSPLFPSTHPVIHALSSPLPPTSSPLYSALDLLKDILKGLRQRCAPARDVVIEELLQELHSPLSSAPEPQSSDENAQATDQSTSTHSAFTQTFPVSPLAQLLVDTIKSILSVTEDMKSDLNTFVLGSLSEAQLRGVVAKLAKLRERELVLDIWGQDAKNGKERIRENWRTWVTEYHGPDNNLGPEENKWILRLLQALQSDKPISCDLPHPEQSADIKPRTSTENDITTQVTLHQLPPQFFFSAPRLFYIQNYLQALVIAASLRSLVRLPPSSAMMSSVQVSPGQDFVERIWTLLKAEINSTEVSGIVGGMKLINLADEVLRARRLLSTSGVIDDEEALQLRSAVDRILRIRDPVFVLLQDRLTSSIGKSLLSDSTTSDSSSRSDSREAIPEKMRSGRSHIEERAGKKPRLMVEGIAASENLSSPRGMAASVSALPAIKGFEDPVLVHAIEDVYRQISASITWVEGVWGDLV